jgi:O-antigen/teichoic acid export membrane protein
MLAAAARALAVRPPRPARTPTRRATSWILLGSLASGAGAYVFQVLGTRALGPEAYAPIGVLWTLQYLLLTTLLYAVESYVTRTVALAGPDHHALAHADVVVNRWIGGAAVAVGVGTWLARDALFDGRGHLAGVVVALVVAYGGFTVVRGRFAGANRFRSYGAATALESTARIGFAVAVLAIAPRPGPLAWIMPLGPLLVVAWWLWDRRLPVHADEPVTVDAPVSGTGRFLAATTVANTVNQVLLAAGPLVLVALGAGAAEVAVFFVTVTAARLPLAFAYGGLLSRLLPPLTRLARAGQHATLARVALLTTAGSVALAAGGAVVAQVLGPPLVAFFFGASFRPTPLFAALAGAGVVLATGALVVNQVLVARGAETRLIAPWLAALGAAAVTVALVPASATLRVSAALVVGEVVALAALLAATLTAPPLPGRRAGT